ncbi:MAG: redox-regulated ATPase YchF [Pseudomonadota bacterium]
MAVSCGIVGLPNVGKSTLFNALSAAGAEVANYPFCTIEPNVGVVPVPDARLTALVELYHPKSIVPATVNFVDIAGLVRGASKGEGLGNQFLANIRETDAIAHVVRCFEDDNIVHVEGRIDPVSDVATIDTELCLKDLETVDKRIERAKKALKGGQGAAAKDEKLVLDLCERVRVGLDAGKPARAQGLSADEQALLKDAALLTLKKVFYIANVAEGQLAKADDDPQVAKLRAHAAAEKAPVVVICAAAEAEIASLDEGDRPAFLESLGLKEPGLNLVAHTAYDLLDLITFLTAGEDECRAWTIKRGSKAPQAAGAIHTDFERGFIKAEVIWWEDLIRLRSESACRAAAKLNLEGKDYVVRDGDVIHFKFNV